MSKDDFDGEPGGKTQPGGDGEPDRDEKSHQDPEPDHGAETGESRGPDRVDPAGQAAEGDEAMAVQAAPGARTPQGTMAIVLLYAVVTVLLWFYMYYIVLRSEGILGGA